MDRNELLLRLERFALRIMDIADTPSRSRSVVSLLEQLSRSGTSPALNYAEALGTISIKDFVSKLSVCVKELRETRTNLILLNERLDSGNKLSVNDAIQECNELISILVRSINTTQKRYNLTDRHRKL